MPWPALPKNVIEDPRLRDRELVFRDREEAGRALVKLLKPEVKGPGRVLAIPCGGVPVGKLVAEGLNFELDLIVARKLQLPWNPEAGFGAVTAEGPVYLNQELLVAAGLTQEDFDRAEAKTRAEVRRREKLFRGERPAPELKGREVMVVDDGLASGYTMLAAVKWVKEQKPERLIVAVPTASLGSLIRISPEANLVAAANVRTGLSFAVANAYENWHDVKDQEVLDARPGQEATLTQARHGQGAAKTQFRKKSVQASVQGTLTTWPPWRSLARPTRSNQGQHPG
jgi:predicted phosphoribosyltransferase